eukprot:TRINITY_DN3619_c1_g1_i7.p1 TRINITY_DN3619_c1_g1~~TRINITY_DN3619_c1_g1_i7.p1  ORF type:complete len:778 (-),score=113.89 TRINITY_DN3619_c1_g1_i7:306-2639(-)
MFGDAHLHTKPSSRYASSWFILLVLLSDSGSAFNHDLPTKSSGSDECTSSVADGSAVHTVSSGLIQRSAISTRLETSTKQDASKGSPTAAWLMQMAAEEGIANQRSDILQLLSSLSTSLTTCMICICAFIALRKSYPNVYSGNVLNGTAPKKPLESAFSWVWASLETTTDEAAQTAGLDCALFIEFNNLSIKILVVLGIPMCLVFSTIHYMEGLNGGTGHQDILHQTTIANAVIGHTYTYFAHAVALWICCLWIKAAVWKAQDDFIHKRFVWLSNLQSPRATTILVENIPENYRSEAKVREFFLDAFPAEAIKEIFVVQKSEELEKLVEKRDAAEEGKLTAELTAAKEGTRPTMRMSCFGRSVDSIDYYTKDLNDALSQIPTERERLQLAASTVGGVNSHAAFVTFANRRDAMIAKEAIFSPHIGVWKVSQPPEPSSICWQSLRHEEDERKSKYVGGCCAIALFYLMFTPLTVGISNLAMAVDMGPAQPIWASLAPTIGLTLVLAFAPTIFLAIIRHFFCLLSKNSQQHALQVQYYWFQVFQVVLLPLLAIHIIPFISKVIQNPNAFMITLADKLPGASIFFLNFLVVQWATHCVAAVRHINLAKFIAFRWLFSEAEAYKRSEPEDQDYYGIGARSARCSLTILIGIIFMHVEPLIPVVALLDMLTCRIVFGYLIVFAETRKPDLGGEFWVTQLKQILQGSVFYCVLVTGLLARRSTSWVPAGASFLCLLYMVYACSIFEESFRWRSLPFKEEIGAEASADAKNAAGSYKQPVLNDD